MRRRGVRAFAVPLTVLVVLALAMVLFVVPMRTWLNQRDVLSAKETQYTAYEGIIENMQDQVSYLQSPAGLRDAIRSQLGYLYPSERRVPMMDMPALSTMLPERWPYTIVSTMMFVKTLEAAQADAKGTISLDPLLP
ncbi:MAG: hypothetical protein D4R44_07905 [Actinobacteria bacterium]|nr:MAG: hypothetical protein D4R44_07905 [Actinomycetota bacterium]